jgi:LacI family transcriptional regulator
VAPDNIAIGRLAAQHFLERGHRNVAFLGHSTPLFEQHRLQGRRSTPLFVLHRLQGFQETAQAAGAEVFIFVQPGLQGWSRESVMAPIRQWLAQLPRPLAVMGDDDDTARLVLEACRNHFHVPEEIAVIGVNNNVHLCELSTPALSSIDTGSQRVGFQAAALLNDLMNGKSPPSEPIAVVPGDVQVRRSSDVYAIQDPAVAKAMRYIQDHATDEITIPDICNEVFLSARNLELRFKQATGRSPRDQIRVVRIQRAMRLLATGVSIATVATQSGFSSQSRFGQLFRRHTGMTPLAYRRGLHEGRTKLDARTKTEAPLLGSL